MGGQYVEVSVAVEIGRSDTSTITEYRLRSQQSLLSEGCPAEQQPGLEGLEVVFSGRRNGWREGAPGLTNAMHTDQDTAVQCTKKADGV
jgi:hypothetical protein